MGPKSSQEKRSKWVRRSLKVFGVLTVLLVLGITVGLWLLVTSDEREPSRVAFAEHCASCHGAALEGSPDGPPLVGDMAALEEPVDQIAARIEDVHADQDLEVWRDSISSESIRALALFVSERRQRWPSTIDSYRLPTQTPAVDSRLHGFRVERWAELTGAPYSLAPLPDGRVLVAEKSRGLSIIDANGRLGSTISGTPEVFDPLVSVRGMKAHIGSMLDVQLHPHYAENGWIYLSYAHRCESGCGVPWPKSMVRVVRGRIRGDQWTDEELIWSVDPRYYTVVPDNVACGRLAFDNSGFLYVTVGGKAPYKHLHDLDTPYGKIHRVHDDGTVPGDNPVFEPSATRTEGSTRHTVFSFGHRTAQGLTGDPETGAIWSTEMGPRGGDEINHIVAGGNYGWPLYTAGLDYDGEPNTIGTDLGLDFPFESTVPPVVDLSPAPAVSNLTFYAGDAFPGWEGDLLVGSLKARTLYRMRFLDPERVELEKLVTDIGRIRDVEVGADGLVYIAVDHQDRSLVLRLVPEPMRSP
ncbi:MAG: PQQ-dependent sugar dehydrogenase [Pseudomonadota bacterium]